MEKKRMPHRKWSKEEKLRYIRLHLDEHISIREIEKKYGVSNSMVSAWVKRYLEDGEEALEPKNGNPYAALHTSCLLYTSGSYQCAGGACGGGTKQCAGRREEGLSDL